MLVVGVVLEGSSGRRRCGGGWAHEVVAARLDVGRRRVRRAAPVDDGLARGLDEVVDVLVHHLRVLAAPVDVAAACDGHCVDAVVRLALEVVEVRVEHRSVCEAHTHAQ